MTHSARTLSWFSPLRIQRWGRGVQNLGQRPSLLSNDKESYLVPVLICHIQPNYGVTDVQDRPVGKHAYSTTGTVVGKQGYRDLK